MSELVVGDLVFVKNKYKVTTSPILAIFQHYRNVIRFLDIYTNESINPLRLTPLHSLLVVAKYDKHPRYTFAQDVSINDIVFSSDLHQVRVINIKETLIYNDSGYAPLTFEGNIIVNDILASCYATYDHSIMHIITTPIRWWFYMLYEFYQSIEFIYVQKLTSNIVISLVDFYFQ